MTTEQFTGDPTTPCLNCGATYAEHDNRFENTELPDTPNNTVWVEGCPITPDAEPMYFEPGMNVYVTFGSRYRYERHPLEHWVHPDGWLRIVAPSLHLARARVFDLLGANWAFDYDDESFMRDDEGVEFYPLGELAVFTRHGPRLTAAGIRALLTSYRVTVTE